MKDIQIIRREVFSKLEIASTLKGSMFNEAEGFLELGFVVKKVNVRKLEASFLVELVLEQL